MGLSPQPLHTAEQHQALEQKETGKRTHLSQQEDRVGQGLPHAQRRRRRGERHGQITPQRTPSHKGHAHCTWNQMGLTTQHPKVHRRQLRCNF